MPEPGRARPIRVIDELGLAKSLPCAAGDFLPLSPGAPGAGTLFLGLGPEPERLPLLIPGLEADMAACAVRFIEAPGLAEQYGPAWRARIPAQFSETTPNEPTDTNARLILYRPGPRLFPGFFGPLLARLALARMSPGARVDPRLIWLPGDAGSLLRIELREALEALGFRVRELDNSSAPRDLLAQGERPALFLSVNFRGIDPLGETAHLLEAAGAKLAVWCVDNPLHLLSGLRGRFWTRLPIFVTDDWFMEPLRRLGAQRVFHLPLAARERDLAAPPRRPSPAWADLAGRLVFAGRSAFPGKDGFFAGCALPAAAWTEAERMLQGGGRPDFGWWLARLGIDRLWPGSDVRRAGFCAEETGRAWRTSCLRRAHADLGGALSVFGDPDWRDLLPEGADLRGPVDYYAALPDICASAAACLNCTSPLLPRGLTQRHFDVFAWGGLLLSDATPGLGLFPAELGSAITFRRPDDIAPLMRRLLATDASALKSAWRAELAAKHTYRHRVLALLEAAGL
jgi:hypothetical protein